MSIAINTDYICKNVNNMGHDANGNLTHRTANDIKYIVVHYTGCADSTAKNACIYYRDAVVGASANYFVDFNGDIYQSVEDLDIAWHVGIGVNPKPGMVYNKPDGITESSNWTCLGIEMCCRKENKASGSAYDTDWYFENATVDSTVELVKYLMEKYGIDTDHIIRHYDCNTWWKPCPRPFQGDDINTHYGKTGNQLFAEFKTRCAGAEPTPAPSQEVVSPWIVYPQKYVGKIKVKMAKVKVEASNSGDDLEAWPSLGKGNLIDVLGQTSSSNWSYVLIAGKYYGWVMTKYIVDSRTNKTSTYVQAIEKYKKNVPDYVARVTKKGTTPVRVSPNSKADKVITHPALGTANLIEVLGTNEAQDWVCVNITGVKGWVSADAIVKA